MIPPVGWTSAGKSVPGQGHRACDIRDTTPLSPHFHHSPVGPLAESSGSRWSWVRAIPCSAYGWWKEYLLYLDMMDTKCRDESCEYDRGWSDLKPLCPGSSDWVWGFHHREGSEVQRNKPLMGFHGQHILAPFSIVVASIYLGKSVPIFSLQ